MDGCGKLKCWIRRWCDFSGKSGCCDVGDRWRFCVGFFAVFKFSVVDVIFFSGLLKSSKLQKYLKIENN